MKCECTVKALVGLELSAAFYHVFVCYAESVHIMHVHRVCGRHFHIAKYLAGHSVGISFIDVLPN